MKNYTLLLTSLLTFFAHFSHSATFNVANITEFQTALTTAGNNGENDIIVVAPGTYNVSTTLTYYSAENYSLTITGSSAATTILDGGGTIQIINLQTTTASGDITLSGITFSHGRSTYGGVGLNIETAIIQISNCVFTGSVATDFGGGLGIYSVTGEIYIDQCTFTNNSSSGNDAGGLYVGTDGGLISLTNSTINNNSALGDDAGGCMLYSDNAGTVIMHGNTISSNLAAEDAGGAMVYLLGTGASATIYDNVFEDNRAYLGGGGCWIRMPGGGTLNYYNNTHHHNTTDIGSGAGVRIELQINGNMDVTNNLFESDSAGLLNGVTSDGGGLWIEHGSGTINVSQNDFFDNYAYYNGGAAFIYTTDGTVNVSRNRVAGNHASNVGGGFSFASVTGTINSFNNSYYNNLSDASGGGEYFYFDNVAGTTHLYNNIYWHNNPESIDFSGSVSPGLTYCLVEGGTGEAYFGTGCIDTDPLFEDPANNNLLLSWDNYPTNDATKSPCIDAGDPTSPNDPDASVADMGAYYYGAGLGFEQNNDQEQISVFPNPSNGNFSIEAHGNCAVTIWNTQGQLIEEQNFVNKGNVSIATQSEGTYLLRIVTPNGIFTRKAWILQK
ncbi:MAG: hypothetical protein CVU11_10775 [Bacteroidetes bacterium HGW-Bacteroidetes-6]|jgi:hypothetical protein|nr:MAG: hypothetical protein CVU11_10775 [Bacteroidetes bacterium HGW-Bacteroidetes-6]